MASLPEWFLRFSSRATCMLGATSTVLLIGCAKFERTKQCGLLIDTVNASLTEIAQSSTLENADTSALARESRQIAERYEKFAADVGKLDLRTPELRGFAERYQRLAQQAALTLRAVAEARARQEFEVADTKRKEYENVAREEGPLVLEVNHYCSK